MFQVILLLDKGSEIENINKALPSSWKIVEMGDSPDVFWLENRHNKETVGDVSRKDGKIKILANEKTWAGKEFWIDFSLKYQELNPFDLRFGILYLSGENGKLWELDEFPKHNPADVLEDVSHYKHIDRAYFVSFFQGDWHWQSQLQVQSCKKINRDGSLGKNEGKRLFLLGNFENKSLV